MWCYGISFKLCTDVFQDDCVVLWNQLQLCTDVFQDDCVVLWNQFQTDVFQDDCTASTVY